MNSPRNALRVLRSAALALAAACLASACAGDNATEPNRTSGTPADTTPASVQTTGVVIVTVDGLPGGTAADITLTPPGGIPLVVTATTQLNGAPLGVWRLSAAPVSTGGNSYRPDTTGREATLAKGDTVRIPVRYSLATGGIAIAVTGLPEGAAGSVSVTGPNGFTQTLTSTTTLTGLEPGSYSIRAADVRANGIDYVPSPATRTVTVSASPVAAAAPLTYVAQVGRLVITTSGLPAGVTPTFTLTGTTGTRTLAGDATVEMLAPGSYELFVDVAGTGDSRFAPTVASTSITISAGTTTNAAISYVAIATVGRLAVAVSGLPGDVNADVTVTGPGGYARVLTGSALLNALTPGRYVISARTVRTPSGTLGVTPPQREIDITAGDSVSLGVTYAPLPATIEVLVTGPIPGGAARITLTSPSGGTIPLTSSRLFEGESGRWRLAALPIVSGGNSYVPTPAEHDHTVLAGDTLRLPVVYAISTGSIAIAITGLPAGTGGSVTVSGPAGYSQSVTSTTTITNLVPGAYIVSAAIVTASGKSYAPATAVRTVTVNASVVASPAPVAYVLAIGRLAITTTGLPDGAVPTFTLTGVGGSRTLTGAGTTDSLSVGSYTLAAGSVNSAGSTYAPTPPVATVTINVGSTTTTSFTYSAPSGPNVAIENVYVTQAVQNWSGTAPVIVGRDALLRVFVKASTDNTWQPDVRARIYDGATLLQTVTINSAGASVPTVISEGSLGSSWNVVIPAGNVRANLRVLAEVDPSNMLGESFRADNSWPASGAPATIATSIAPALTVRLVPVTIGALTGNVNDANREQYMQTTRRLLPLNQVTSNVRAPFTSNTPELQSNNANGGWTLLLSEINALRASDGATGHYVGVVKAGYGSGYAGFAYIPGRASVVWDNFPSGDAVTAHELGHNFARPHSPCGVSGDPSYPFPGGVIGSWGWNGSSLVSPSATDIMGYCGNQWISDWSWTRMAEWRRSSGLEAPVGATGEALLVWGRIRDGQVVLEPAFRVRASATPRPAKSSHRIVMSNADGAVRLEVPIDPERVDHEAGHDELHFAVVVPWSEQLERDVASIAVLGARSPFPSAVRISPVKAQQSGALTMPDPAASVQVVEPTRARVHWDAATYPMAMVQDAVTGEILSFVRKPGDGFNRGNATDVILVFSDGVRSATRRLTARD